MEVQTVGVSRVYIFGRGLWRVTRQHHCHSCGLTEQEEAEIEAFNRGIERCLPVLQQMEARILELEGGDE